VDLSGWVGVGLGGNCDCRCGILYAPMLGGGFVGLVSLISSSYSSEIFVLGRGVGLTPWFCCVCVCVGLAHLVLWKWDYAYIACLVLILCFCRCMHPVARLVEAPRYKPEVRWFNS